MHKSVASPMMCKIYAGELTQRFIMEFTTNGKMQFIVNQDRDNIYPLHLFNLHSELVEQDGVCFGLNLFMENEDGYDLFLGTFDTVEEVINEINEIYNTDLEIYCVSGFDETLYSDETPNTIVDYDNDNFGLYEVAYVTYDSECNACNTHKYYNHYADAIKFVNECCLNRSDIISCNIYKDNFLVESFI